MPLSKRPGTNGAAVSLSNVAGIEFVTKVFSKWTYVVDVAASQVRRSSEPVPKILPIPKGTNSLPGGGERKPEPNRKGSDWVAEITPVPSPAKEPIKAGSEAIEIDKWLKLVESYWQTRRGA